MKFILPPNSPQRFDVILPFKPRSIYPVYYYDYERLLMLVPMEMEQVRKFSTSRCKETPIARRNLQVWVNTLGEALYNPVMWHYRPNAKSNKYIFEIRGMHRTRALEALNFNFIYIYFVIGKYTGLPNEVVRIMRKNIRNPTISTYPKKCSKCDTSIYKYFKVDDLTRFYKCKICGYEGSNQHIYPEPM